MKLITEIIFTFKKLGVILITGVCASAAAALHAYITWPEMMARTRALDDDIGDMVRMPMICENSIIFIATAYYVAQKLAAWIGDFKSAALLKAQSSNHLRLLHAMCGILIVACRYFFRSYYGAPIWQNAVMVTFGVFLVITAILKKPNRNVSTLHAVSPRSHE